MKQNTMFPSLIQKFISDEELQPLIKLVGYEDTVRKLTVKTLIQYLVTAAFCEWKSLRYCADVGSAAGLIKLFDLVQKTGPAGLCTHETGFCAHRPQI
ncbi:hypothetical protein [Domibacillus aminovorans]|uniref:hypothetical protein n=1 Tax=Domibacillus aminovorans TaxID=29332 RepID=UPI0007C73691|nr:hypothetical protein [Domibacillus aminovorans]